VTLHQALACVYLLSQSVELQPSAGGQVRVSLAVGWRGDYDCQSCTQQEERGHCPLLPESTKGTQATYLDDSFDEARAIYSCPQGVVLRHPGLVPTLATFFTVMAATPAGYYGADGLVGEACRVADAFRSLTSIERSFEAQIRSRRAMMDRAGGE